MLAAGQNPQPSPLHDGSILRHLARGCQTMVKNLLSVIKHIKTPMQLGAFGLVVLLLLFGQSSTGEYPLRLVVTVMILVVFIVAFPVICKNYFEHLKSKSWQKETGGWLKSQDPTKSPAYIASSEMRLNEGRTLAYKHCLEEIDKTQDINELKSKIEGALGSIESKLN